MDSGKSKWKNYSTIKNLVVSLSFESLPPKSSRMEGATIIFLSKSKSWHCVGSDEKPQQNHDEYKTRYKIAPKGCFSVYVGPAKQRFVIKAKCANHPLFKMLNWSMHVAMKALFCFHVILIFFYKVLAEMDSGKEAMVDDSDSSAGGGFAYGSRSPFSPYELLTPSRLLNIN
ncbi:uncharacterized protein [Coffea arabica]|uniref:Uncharacterized protein n=1 Tax=Coffea arabica TaxID=13443 RepID=A0A6P6XAV9_COFAR|nr:uncharacterized protein LOC113740680 [Coffea arabica]